MLKVRRPSPVLTSVEAVPSGHVAPVDDNFAFIDQLLDTLQSEGDSGKGQTADAAQEREGNAGSDCFPGMDDLQDSPTSLMIDSTAVLDNDTLSALITRFCEEGDESIVDRLLDNFLKSTSDAGNLVDAIGKPSQMHSRKTLHLNLDQMKKSDPLEKSADSWDALLNSARGVLLSARASQSQSPPGSLPDSPKSILSSADGRRKRRGRSSSSRDAGQQLSEEVAPVGEAEISPNPPNRSFWPDLHRSHKRIQML